MESASDLMFLPLTGWKTLNNLRMQFPGTILFAYFMYMMINTKLFLLFADDIIVYILCGQFK